MPDSLARVLADPLLLIFTVISAAYFINGLRTGWQGWQMRHEWFRGPLRPETKPWAERAAFLLGVPLGVVVHEFGHALATWLFGGRIVEFGYFFYWGYVVAAGDFSPAQDWFISLAGTLGTLVYGVAVWLLLRGRTRPLARYLGLRTFRFQLYFGLIYYPLFTLFTFVGDWRVIYDFSATPLLSGATLVAHLALLALFFWQDRQGAFEMIAFADPAVRTRYETLQQQAAQNLLDTDGQYELVELTRRGGAPYRARRLLKALMARAPQTAAYHLHQAALLSDGKRRIPRNAVREVEKALSLGLSERNHLVFAHHLLAQYHLDRNAVDEALRHLDTALASAAGEETASVANLHYLRALARRRKGQYAAAQDDIARAIQLAEALGNKPAADHYRREQETINRHAARFTR